MGPGVLCRIWLQGAGFHVNFEGTVTILLRNLDINLLNRGLYSNKQFTLAGMFKGPFQPRALGV